MIQKNPNIFFLCCPISKRKSYCGIDMFDPIISRFTDKTYIHKTGKHGIKVESSSFPTKLRSFQGLHIKLVWEVTTLSPPDENLFKFLVQIDFPRIINFLIPSFYIFRPYQLFISCFIQVGRGPIIFSLGSVYSKIYLTHIIISSFFTIAYDFHCI